MKKIIKESLQKVLKESNDYVESIFDYLMSPDESNRKLALVLMENNPELEQAVEAEAAKRFEGLPELLGMEWMDFCHLKTIDLIDKQITYLPESIGNLAMLRALYIVKTQITALPESIGNLGMLSGLHLTSTPITYLPESIGNLGRLQHLGLSGTKIKALPESIGNLEQLIVLKISYTGITDLPKSIGRLTQLKELYASKNIVEKNRNIIVNFEKKGCKVYY